MVREQFYTPEVQGSSPGKCQNLIAYIFKRWRDIPIKSGFRCRGVLESILFIFIFYFRETSQKFRNVPNVEKKNSQKIPKKFPTMLNIFPILPNFGNKKFPNLGIFGKNFLLGPKQKFGNQKVPNITHKFPMFPNFGNFRIY